MKYKPPKGTRTATCRNCGKQIYQYLNKERIEDRRWYHTHSITTSCDYTNTTSSDYTNTTTAAPISTGKVHLLGASFIFSGNVRRKTACGMFVSPANMVNWTEILEYVTCKTCLNHRDVKAYRHILDKNRKKG